MIDYEKAQYLKSLIEKSYKIMSNDDYVKIKAIFENLNKNNLDEIIKEALAK